MFGFQFAKKPQLRVKTARHILSVIDMLMLLIIGSTKMELIDTKKIADAMGHDLETHLKSYSRFNTKDLENAFDCVVERLEKTIEIPK